MKIKEQKSSVEADQAPRDPNAETPPQEPNASPGALVRMERQVQDAMQALIDAKLVTVRRESMWLEIEINADILFPSGAGDFSAQAAPVLDKLAEVLKPFPNPIRVEGHTDDRPIKTASFPSNWELSAARAASVVHEFTKAGIDPLRLEIVGFGEFHPRQSNGTVEGRNANRRVAILVLESVAPGNPVTVKTGEQPVVPDGASAEPGGSSNVAIADAAAAENRLLWRVQPSELSKTVLVKDRSKADAVKDSAVVNDSPAASGPPAVKDAPTTE
jgi:chemotaxis protein MotB